MTINKLLTAVKEGCYFDLRDDCIDAKKPLPNNLNRTKPKISPFSRKNMVN